MSEKTFVVMPEKCTGCRTCELSCAYSHAIAQQPGVPRIRAYNTKPPLEKGVPVVCFQCDVAACQAVCPTKALQRNLETGAIFIDYGRCINCHACYAACPFGNIHIEHINDRVAKCDLCSGAPKCAMFCPTGALTYR